MNDRREPPDEELARAKEYALALLDRRPHTTRELQKKLRQKDFSEATVASVVAFLTEYRYLDDASFAAEWVSHRTRIRPAGRRRLKQELMARGVARDTARVAIRENLSPEEELAAAIELLATRYARITKASRSDSNFVSEVLPKRDPALKRRLGEFLFRRGFDYDTVLKALRTVLGDDNAEGLE